MVLGRAGSENLSLLERFDADIEARRWRQDAAQKAAVRVLQALADELRQSAPARKRRFGERLLTLLGNEQPTKSTRGVYLWGGVGRGKTYLVDLFHQSLPDTKKLRIHFHSFMQRVHAELSTLSDMTDPLRTVASRLAQRYRVVTVDEFHVSDITDAMLLGRLLRALFAEGVCLVTTSNLAPDELYQDGLQRARFLPAIELIKTEMRIVHLTGDTDYRLRALERGSVYHHPLGAAAAAGLLSCFESVAAAEAVNAEVLQVQGRPVRTVCCAADVVWFEFKELCETARSVADYIEIARRFHTVLVANVRQLTADDSDATKRFIQLVDEFYDRKVKLVVSAETRPHALYVGVRLAFAFERTRSRLEEMQSHAYLARQHIP